MFRDCARSMAKGQSQNSRPRLQMPVYVPSGTERKRSRVERKDAEPCSGQAGVAGDADVPVEVLRAQEGLSWEDWVALILWP